MGSFCRKGIGSVLLVLVSMLATWQIANAWVSTKSWDTTNAEYGRNYLNTTWKSIADYGAAGWNSVSGSNWYFWYTSGSNNNPLYYSGIDGSGGYAATTAVSSIDGEIIGFTMTFDNAESWYTGTGTPGANQIDSRSISRHEFGHALGLSHTQTWRCSYTTSDPTMCVGYLAGTSYKRTLETDDKNGVAYLY